jgi:CheY-like chemotaxis protein
MTRPLVLIVDDNPMSLELVSFLLEANGLDVSTAPNVAAARMCIDARRPDLVLMDIQMPGVDGLTFTRELKGDPATQAIPIVAFTAYAMKSDEIRMREAGCVGFLTKPIDVKGFSARVKAYLQTGMAMDF